MFTAAQAREMIRKVEAMTAWEDLNDMAAELEMDLGKRRNWLRRIGNALGKPARMAHEIKTIKMMIQMEIVGQSYNED